MPPGAFPLLALLLLAALSATRLGPEARYAALFYGHPLKGKTVVLDPGHGGIDPGAHHDGEFTEKEVVLAVGLELRRLLEQAGAAVVMTRESDRDVSHHTPGDPATRYQRDMQSRVKIINGSGADLFISIHVNTIHDPNVRGAIAFYREDRPENKRLAEVIHRQINPVVSVNPQPGQYIHQEPKVGNYLLLNCAEIPGIILEMAFMTSPDDRELIARPSYRRKLAEAIFFGLVEYFYGQ